MKETTTSMEGRAMVVTGEEDGPVRATSTNRRPSTQQLGKGQRKVRKLS